MELASAGLSGIPIPRLTSRRLHLGPFDSGRDLVKFVCMATLGAAVAAATSVVVWLPFLGLAAVVAFVRVGERRVDDYAIGYCRYRWRKSAQSSLRISGSASAGTAPREPVDTSPHVQVGGIPLAHLPPAELERIFAEWRSTLTALDRPISYRMRGERFSPLPFLPPALRVAEPERAALAAYRQLVRALLRNRFHRVVDIRMGEDPSPEGSRCIGAEVQLEDFTAQLARLGVPTAPTSTRDSTRLPIDGTVP